MSEPKVTKQDILNASSQMLNKDLYVVFTKPTNGLGPVMENIEEHLNFKCLLEKGVLCFVVAHFGEIMRMIGSGKELLL